MGKSARDVFDRVSRIVKSVEAGAASGEDGTVIREMDADQFLEHAAAELVRCETDTPLQARKRLRVLAKAVAIVKALNWEETTTAKVPVMNDSTTSDKDKSETGGSLTVKQPAATLFSENASGEWTAKAEALRERLAAVKSDGDPSEDDDEAGARMKKPPPAAKKQWTTKYVNDLPDSAFLYVEKGAKKDGDGKSERSKRHFPVRDATGKVDVAHATDAIGRIPQSDAPGLTAAKKTELQDAARKLVAETKKKLAKGSGGDGWPNDVAGAAAADNDWGSDDVEATV